MNRQGKASRRNVEEHRLYDSPRRLPSTLFLDVVLCCLGVSVLAAQRPPFEQQMRENQRRLEDIRRERSAVEQELERLRTQAHSIADELSNLERQRDATNRIVNELDRQIGGLGLQIDQKTVGLILAPDAPAEKQAGPER